VSERWITDASPLIILSKVGKAELLSEIPGELLIPEAVAEEVLQGPPGDPARLLLESGFGQRQAPEEIPPRVLAWGLGRGETETLALASAESSGRAVVDDAAARRCATALGIAVIGTLGVVARAKRMGRVESAVPVFRALMEKGFRIRESALRTIAEDLGETW
jgi:predicted nucleic acid-binding protein